MGKTNRRILANATNSKRQSEPDDLTRFSKVDIKNHYSNDFIDVEKKIDYNHQQSKGNHIKPSLTFSEEIMNNYI